MASSVSDIDNPSTKAEKLPEGQENRSFVRIPLSAETIVTLLIPDETATRLTVRGLASDISYSGIKIISYQIPKYRFLQLIKGRAHAEIKLILPSLDVPVYLKATVVWADYHEAKEGKQGFCALGMAFHKFSEEARKQFNDVLEHIAEQAVHVQRPTKGGGPMPPPPGAKPLNVPQRPLPPLTHVRIKSLTAKQFEHLQRLATVRDDETNSLSEDDIILRRIALNRRITIDDLRRLTAEGRRFFEAAVWGKE